MALARQIVRWCCVTARGRTVDALVAVSVTPCITKLLGGGRPPLLLFVGVKGDSERLLREVHFPTLVMVSGM